MICDREDRDEGQQVTKALEEKGRRAIVDILTKERKDQHERTLNHIVNEFVKRIIVHEADKSTGKRVQQIEIGFNFIGALDLPAINQPIAVTHGLNKKTA